MKKTIGFIVLICFFIQPVLADGTLPSGSGTSGDPYIISTLNHLLWISTNSASWDKYFSQTADIDASATATWNSNAGWSPIGTDWDHAFYGQYNGGGYSISGLTISRNSSYQGFIGVARDGVVLQNINLTSVSIEMTGNSRVGALVGEFQGSSVTNCHVSGTVKGIGSARIGGLIGQNGNTVSNCSFSGTVTDESGGSSYMGGLIGYNGGSIQDSYASVSITGNNYAGGLIGYNDAGTINKCYTLTPESNSVFGSYYVGGLTGANINSSTITESYSTADIVGYVNYTGGITGINSNSTITDCYSRGSVSRTQDTQSDFGSFIGKNEYTTVITNCYATGAVIYQNAENPTDKGFVGNYSTTGCSKNFFDSQTSVQSSGAGATAKTTSEMNNYSTFVSDGWDFKGETGNGTDDIWNIGNDRNDGYPYFDWQYPGDEVPSPITLVNFKADKIKATVCLSWQTASEINNVQFLIYRNDEILAYIEGAGTTSEPHSYEYIDNQVIPGNSYTYMLADVSYANIETKHTDKAVMITIPEYNIPTEFALGNNKPNPFNPRTAISYSIFTEATMDRQLTVNLSIYNMNGDKVETLVNETQPAGYHEIYWDASGYASGIYFYRLTAGDSETNSGQVFVETKKMVLMK